MKTCNLESLYEKYLNKNLDYTKLKNMSYEEKELLKTEIESYLEISTKKISAFFVSNKYDLRHLFLECSLQEDFSIFMHNFLRVRRGNNKDGYANILAKHNAINNAFDLFSLTEEEFELVMICPKIEQPDRDDFLFKLDGVRIERLKLFISLAKNHNILDKLKEDWENVKNLEKYFDLISVILGMLNDAEINSLLNYESSKIDYIFMQEPKQFLDVFDHYKKRLITNKQIYNMIEKTTFCRNVLTGFETGIFIDEWGYVIDDVQRSEHAKANIEQKLFDIYQNFDNKAFVKKQGNFICEPKMIYPFSRISEKLISKFSINGNILNIGFVIEDFFGQLYFIHISKDVTDKNNNFEIQFNYLPNNSIDNRIQILRMDSYNNQGAHKNVGGSKILTQLHLHVYNKLDLIRGKDNGSYDIEYNLAKNIYDFSQCLNMFCKIINLPESIQKTIKNKIKIIENNMVLNNNSYTL